MRVVILGDSGVYGHDLPQKWTWAYRIQKSFEDHDFWVSGQNGETSRQALERFRHAAMIPNPDLLILQYGHNDANCWETDYGWPRVTADSYHTNLKEMIKKSPARSIVIVPYRPPREKNMPNGRTLAEQIKHGGYERACQSLRNIATVVWPQHALAKRDPGRIFYPEPDALHLTVEGHAVMMDYMLSHMRKFLD